MGIREEQKERRRQAILFGALDLFVKNGYAATKISDIAAYTNMSMGLLFHYFESKEQLYEVLVNMGLEGTKYPAAKEYDHALDYFEQFAKELFSYMQTQPYVAKMFVLMAQAQQNEATPQRIRETALQVNTIDVFASIIEKGQKEGTIRAGDPKALSNAFWCSIQGIAQQYAAHPEIPLPQAEWITDIIKK